jgi:hypothetical protein
MSIAVLSGKGELLLAILATNSPLIHKCGSASVATETRHFQDLSDLRTVNCAALEVTVLGLQL